MNCDQCGKETKAFFAVSKRHNRFGYITSFKWVCKKCFDEQK